MRHKIILALNLAAFWIASSGHYSVLMLSFGAISIALILLIAKQMDVVDHEAQPVHLTLKMPSFYLWLNKEIILSNFTVVKHIWLGNQSISPTMKTIKASQKTDIGKVIYANSITLTPGTVTVALDGDEFLVHALVRDSIEELEAGEMDRRITQLEN